MNTARYIPFMERVDVLVMKTLVSDNNYAFQDDISRIHRIPAATKYVIETIPECIDIDDQAVKIDDT
ncbi:unnamed protein product [Rotaria sp. Silwood2]|nr:unnamed protein product [Rotaria sp. Silwood2]CAF3054699.1 unnamed protein product [Rotaria sp. Silwood2]CAF4088035.1 unnamed protein product [Rotaria sp. Silwood2]CAF4162897.1 unnamed protein product [Rotaria sp. Silwood2]CAF4208911.1 unnamed protein product [Rotaria sp. Silwood2]